MVRAWFRGVGVQGIGLGRLPSGVPVRLLLTTRIL